MSIVNLKPGTSTYHLLRQFALAETTALLATDRNVADTQRRAANVSLALAMEKYAWDKMSAQVPNLKRMKPLADSIDMGFAESGEKLLELSVVKTAVYLKKGDDIVHLRPSNFYCDPYGMLLYPEVKDPEDFALGRMPNTMDVEEVMGIYAKRLGIELDFEEFDRMRQTAGQDLLREQPGYEVA